MANNEISHDFKITSIYIIQFTTEYVIIKFIRKRSLFKIFNWLFIGKVDIQHYTGFRCTT